MGWYGGFWHHNNKQSTGRNKNHNAYSNSKSRAYVVCRACDRWVYVDRNIKDCPCGIPYCYGANVASQGPPSALEGAHVTDEITGALEALGKVESTKPLAEMLKSLLLSAGVLSGNKGGESDDMSHLSYEHQIKISFANQRKCNEKVIKCERQQASRKSRIESLQMQIDAINTEYVQGKQDLDKSRADA